MQGKGKILASLFVSLVCVMALYVALHEGGHALAAVLCGARITQFSILGAHMSYEGGGFSGAALALFDLAGMLLPVLASIASTAAYRSRLRSIPYRMFSFLFFLIPTGSILAWVMVPVLAVWGQAPPDDDVTKFISHSGLSPWAVMLGAVLLFGGCLWLAWRKRLPQDYWATVKQEA